MQNKFGQKLCRKVHLIWIKSFMLVDSCGSLETMFLHDLIRFKWMLCPACEEFKMRPRGPYVDWQGVVKQLRFEIGKFKVDRQSDKPQIPVESFMNTYEYFHSSATHVHLQLN